MERIKESYRRHSLVVGKTESGWIGVVWKDGAKVNSCEGVGKGELLETLRSWVDESFVTIARERSAPPSGDDYVRAFQSIMEEIPDSYWKMLKAHYHAPDQVITATGLADAADYASYSPANLHYGTLGKMLYEVLPVEVYSGKDGKPVYTFALATAADRDESEENWKWKLRPEVAYAVEKLGLAT